MRIRHLSCVGVAIAMIACATTVLARDVKLHLNDGRVITGTYVSEDAQGVTIRISQINSTFPRTVIGRMETVPSVAEQYAQRRAALADSDIDGRYALVNWLYENKDYPLALRELAQLRSEAPDDARMAVLQRAIEGQMAAAARRDSRSAVEGAAAAEPAGEPPAQENLLSEQQINLIKVYEIDLDQRPPVDVPREVVDRILKEYADNDRTPKGSAQQAAFRGAPGWQKLALMFDLKARPLYPLVQVRTDPPALATFRREFHTNYVVNYCAATQCHGGPAGGDLLLIRDGRRSEEQVYTNFFILNQYEDDAGRMINRNDPDRSLLLQYGLERSSAKTPHPDVPGWRPHFQNEQAPRFVAMVDWMRSLYPSPPLNYSIEDYTPPKAHVAPAPEAEPAPAP
jgi:hypothetical protein